MDLDVIFSCIILIPKCPASHTTFHYPDTGLTDKSDSPHTLTIRVCKYAIPRLQFLSLKPAWTVWEAANGNYSQ